MAAPPLTALTALGIGSVDRTDFPEARLPEALGAAARKDDRIDVGLFRHPDRIG